MNRVPATVLSLIATWVVALPATAGLVAIAYNNKTQMNEFRSINPATGQSTLLNSFTFAGGFWQNGTLTADNMGHAFALASGRLYRFDAATGQILGNPLLQADLADIVFAGNLHGARYSPFPAFHLNTVDPVSGAFTPLTSFTLNTGLTSLTAAQGSLFIASQNRLLRLNASTGATESDVPLDIFPQAIIARPDGKVFAMRYNNTTQRNEIRSVNPATGATMLLTTLLLAGWNSLAIDPDTGYLHFLAAGPGKQILYAIDGNTGQIVGTPALDTQLQEIVGLSSKPSVPEPASLLLAATGLMALLARRLGRRP
ncbi:MAG: PEP-CTERM sorting domain-containing protein [Acidobacteria bacterium]|nr:PEP-CTERM sorting domain-containing protein [Acidobacteriota bacterium]